MPGGTKENLENINQYGRDLSKREIYLLGLMKMFNTRHKTAIGFHH
jgi:hypothetical protein